MQSGGLLSSKQTNASSILQKILSFIGIFNNMQLNAEAIAITVHTLFHVDE